jgi:hypothetical protein
MAWGQRDIQRGVRQFVVGTGGKELHPFDERLKNSQVRNSTDHGILKLALHASSYRWRFISVTDDFTDTGFKVCH